MNYFELYNLPVNFNPDQQLVKQRFYALSKQHHPDFYINESVEKQDEVLELATLNNKAYQVLKDPQKRLHYILELKNLLVEGENYTLPQSFLMEMMDVNEALMDLEMDPDANKIEQLKSDIAALELALSIELDQLTKEFDSNGADQEMTILKGIKDVYYRNKYLLRIKQSLARLAI